MNTNTLRRVARGVANPVVRHVAIWAVGAMLTALAAAKSAPREKSPGARVEISTDMPLGT